MPNFLLRIIAALLVPCLLADPTLAAALSQHSIAIRSSISATDLFQEQALASTLVGAQRYSTNLNASAVRVGAIVIGLLAVATPVLANDDSTISPAKWGMLGFVSAIPVVWGLLRRHKDWAVLRPINFWRNLTSERRLRRAEKMIETRFGKEIQSENYRQGARNRTIVAEKRDDIQFLIALEVGLLRARMDEETVDILSRHLAGADNYSQQTNLEDLRAETIKKLQGKYGMRMTAQKARNLVREVEAFYSMHIRMPLGSAQAVSGSHRPGPFVAIGFPVPEPLDSEQQARAIQMKSYLAEKDFQEIDQADLLRQFPRALAFTAHQVAIQLGYASVGRGYWVRDISRARVLLFGEYHDRPRHLEVMAAMKTGRYSHVAIEVPGSVQTSIDAYMNNPHSDAELETHSEPHQEILKLAKQLKIKVLASEAPDELVEQWFQEPEIQKQPSLLMSAVVLSPRRDAYLVKMLQGVLQDPSAAVLILRGIAHFEGVLAGFNEGSLVSSANDNSRGNDDGSNNSGNGPGITSGSRILNAIRQRFPLFFRGHSAPTVNRSVLESA